MILVGIEIIAKAFVDGFVHSFEHVPVFIGVVIIMAGDDPARFDLWIPGFDVSFASLVRVVPVDEYQVEGIILEPL